MACGVRPHRSQVHTALFRAPRRSDLGRMAQCPLLAPSGRFRPRLSMSAFGGKADMTFAAHMSANDPKRTPYKGSRKLMRAGAFSGLCIWNMIECRPKAKSRKT